MTDSHARTLPLHAALRGIAACWIALSHLFYNPIYGGGFARTEDAGIFAPLLRFDFLAVDFFFVMSGCLLTLAYHPIFAIDAMRRRDMDKFYLLRLARIYPLHLLVLLVVGGTALMGINWPHSAGHWAVLWQHRGISLISNLSLTHAWGIIPTAAWNEPAWTISILMLLYTCFPNMLFMLRNMTMRTSVSIAVIAALVIGYALERQFYPLGAHSDGAGAILRGFVFFILGIFVARLYRAGWKSQWPWVRIFYAVLLSGLALIALWWRWQPFDVVAFHLLYAPMILACLYASGGSIGWLLSRVFAWLARRAFAIYMLHYPVMVLLHHCCGELLQQMAQHSVMGRLAAYLLVIAIGALVADLAYRFIERPAQRFAAKCITLKSAAAD